MKCPICVGESLVMSDRQGIEIDYCPKCRGVWLDRGELDKIIERSASLSPQAQPQPQPHRGGHQGGHQEAYRHSDGYGYPKKKKTSLLGELFDF